MTFLILQLKLQNFFPTVVRSHISYFAVVIAIFSMTIVIVDMMVEVDTPKLSVPNRLAPTLDTTGWAVPLLNGNPIHVQMCVLGFRYGGVSAAGHRSNKTK